MHSILIIDDKTKIRTLLARIRRFWNTSSRKFKIRDKKN